MNTKKQTILVADDDRTTRMLLSRILEKVGYRVEQADRGEKCLFLALERKIDGFLIDIRMPGLGGIDLCRRLRDISRYKMTPIIFITSLDEDSSLNDVFVAGATDFISKPVNPVVLKARLMGHLQRVEFYFEIEQVRRYLNRYISSKTQRMVEAYSLTGLLPTPERHHVCVMFTDIRGFTALSRESDLEDLFARVSSHLGRQVDMVYRYGGYIDKFGGDGLMAIFDGDDMTVRACRCALEIMGTIQKKDDKGQQSLPLGIGIHTGPVLIGNIGSEEHLDYSALGETVNLAARLCNNAESMNVDVSEAVVIAAKGDNDLHFTEPRAVVIRGFDEPVSVYKIKTMAETNLQKITDDNEI